MQDTIETNRFINVQDHDDIRLWADLLDVSVDELRFAINRVGNEVERVRRFLNA